MHYEFQIIEKRVEELRREFAEGGFALRREGSEVPTVSKKFRVASVLLLK